MLQGGRTMRAPHNLAACPGMFSVCCATWSSTGNLREDIRQGMMPRDQIQRKMPWIEYCLETLF